MGDFSVFLVGAAGGAVLGGVRFFLSLADLALSTEFGQRKAGQFMATQLLSMLLLAAISGSVSWALDGRAGTFITGFTALSLLLVIAGESVLGLGKKSSSQEVPK